MTNSGWKQTLALGFAAAFALLVTASSASAQSPGARPNVTQQQSLDLVRPSTEDETFGRAPPNGPTPAGSRARTNRAAIGDHAPSRARAGGTTAAIESAAFVGWVERF